MSPVYRSFKFGAFQCKSKAAVGKNCNSIIATQIFRAIAPKLLVTDKIRYNLMMV